ncbi:MAG: hypothetical protein K1X74_15055 [Pirellulales bacterium]|nr:hypothetical protein [Pirellulales bacterium]
MRFYERVAILTLARLAGILACTNLWVTAARSTIPLALATQLLNSEVRHEKHPGQDDVCLWMLADRRVLHVDQEVFAAVPRWGDRLEKQPWERVLKADGRVILLAWSADFRGMGRVMPVVLVVIAAWLAWGISEAGRAASPAADSSRPLNRVQ